MEVLVPLKCKLPLVNRRLHMYSYNKVLFVWVFEVQWLLSTLVSFLKPQIDQKRSNVSSTTTQFSILPVEQVNS